MPELQVRVLFGIRGLYTCKSISMINETTNYLFDS